MKPFHCVFAFSPGEPLGADGSGGRQGFASAVPRRVCGGSATNGNRPPKPHMDKQRQESPPLWEFLRWRGVPGRGFQRGGLGGGRDGTALALPFVAGRAGAMDNRRRAEGRSGEDALLFARLCSGASRRPQALPYRAFIPCPSLSDGIGRVPLSDQRCSRMHRPGSSQARRGRAAPGYV